MPQLPQPGPPEAEANLFGEVRDDIGDPAPDTPWNPEAEANLFGDVLDDILTQGDPEDPFWNTKWNTDWDE